MDEALQFPGSTNSWTMPIKNRLDMLSTGIKTPVGVKIYGNDLKEIERIGLEIENALRSTAGVRSIFSERVTGGYFIDFDLKRERLSQLGLSVESVEEILSAAIGGEEVSRTIEGRERYPIQVRYGRDFRDNPETLKEMLIKTPSGAHVSVSTIADIKIVQGPSMIRDENGRLSGYVYVDVVGRDIGSFVKDAKKIVAEKVHVSEGYSILWSGQYENMIRVKKRLAVVVPVTFLLITLLLYMNTRSWVKTGIVLLAVPFSLVGAIWFLYFLGYNISIATWVGMIALMGLDAETGVFMLLYLDIAYKDAVKAGKMNTRADLEEAVIHGAVKRIRPKMMTVLAAMIGLLPIMWSMGTGADVMKRIAAPMIGGLLTSFIMELLIYPPIYALWKWHSKDRLFGKMK
jgi:Cu(I)/Ag(I) efflux system membrane protein CusA/SilA